MESFLTAFVAAALCEVGDTSQASGAALARDHRRPGTIVAGAAAAAVASSALGVVGGVLVRELVTLRASALLLAIALLYAAAGHLLGVQRTREATGEQPLPATRLPLLARSFLLFLSARIGGGTQFLTLALTAYYGMPVLVASGASAGMVAGIVPFLLLAAAPAEVMPLRAVRYAIGGLFLILGFILVANALRLS